MSSGLVMWASLAAALPVHVVIDNSAPNAPLLAPQGPEARPPAFAQLVDRIAAAAGTPPTVRLALARGRSGRGPTLVDLGAAPCNGVDPCRGGLGAYRGSGSGSGSGLPNAAAAIRANAPDGPRVEIYLTALNGSGSSCTDAARAAQTLRELTAPSDVPPPDHVAVGLVRMTVDPPPRPRAPRSRAERRRFARLEPDRWWGSAPDLVLDDAGCVVAAAQVPWTSNASARSMVLAMLVLGIGTAAADADLRRWLTELESGADGGNIDFGLVRLREPDREPAEISGQLVVQGDDAPAWHVPGTSLVSDLPCERPIAEAALDIRGHAAPLGAVGGDCHGSAELRFDAHGLRAAFVEVAGFDPRIRGLSASGAVILHGDPDAPRRALVALGELNEAQQPVLLWDAAIEALSDPAAGAASAWSHRIVVGELVILGLDRRPFGPALGAAAGIGPLMAWLVATCVRRGRVHRAIRRAWRQSAADPGPQRPVAEGLAEARRAAAAGRGLRWGLGFVVGLVAAMAAMAAVLALHGGRLG